MSVRTRIKICGVTRPEDARLACSLGADAVGIVFAPGSPRCISTAQGVDLRQAVDGFTSLVALFVDPSADEVEAVIERVRPDLLQFHGSEPADFCGGFDRPYLKALPVRQARETIGRFSAARAVIVDSHEPGQPGGTGTTFDWDRFPRDIAQSIILAGGLNPHNVADAVARLAPYGVDVSSGVERAPGIKDQDRLERFFEEVHRADSS